jgi:N-glycosylase/DNA lyase
MNQLFQKIQLLKNSDVHTKVEKRIKEFKTINKNSADDLFTEMCFCILTANFSAERGTRIHSQLSSCLLTDSQERLTQKLQKSGYRFPKTRADYITRSAPSKDTLKTIISSLQGEERREWLVKNIKGLGYKEASHFLRNIGFDDYAIIDSHILDLLERYKFIKKQKTLTRKKYLEIEKILQRIAIKTNLTLAELDLYLWYMETGKIFK